MVEQFIVSGRMKATDVDVSVAWNAILKALLKGLHLIGRSEDSGDSLGNTRLLLQHVIKSRIRDDNNRLRGFDGDGSHAKLLRRGRGVGRPIEASNTRSMLAARDSRPVRSSRGGLGGRVGAAAVLKSWNVRMSTLSTNRANMGAARSVGKHGSRIEGQRNSIDIASRA